MTERRIIDLKAAEYNPRRIDDWELHALKRSMETFGDLSGIIFNRRTQHLVGGHQRVKNLPPDLEITDLIELPEPNEQGTVAHGTIRWKTEAWQYREIDVDEETETAMNIAANKHGGQFDVPQLAKLMSELEASGFDTDLTGFNPDEVSRLTYGSKDEGNAAVEEVPAVEGESITQAGDLWILGRHRLVCGDATELETYTLLMDGNSADLLLTDPPYNVNYQGGTSEALTIANDHMPDDQFREFLRSSYQRANEVMRPGAAFYIWHADSEGLNFRGAAKDVGWTVRQCLIWVKNALVLGRQDYQWKHEPCLFGWKDLETHHDPCLYGWKDGAPHFWNADRKQTTVLEFDRPTRNAEHPTMKPIDLFMYLIRNSSRNEEIVLDPFLGSGTSVLACEQTNRTCYGLELDPRYCDVIVKRWEQFTGQKAINVRLEDGQISEA